MQFSIQKKFSLCLDKCRTRKLEKFRLKRGKQWEDENEWKRRMKNERNRWKENEWKRTTNERKRRKKVCQKSLFCLPPLPQRGLYLLFWPSKRPFYSVRALKRPLHSWRKAVQHTFQPLRYRSNSQSKKVIPLERWIKNVLVIRMIQLLGKVAGDARTRQRPAKAVYVTSNARARTSRNIDRGSQSTNATATAAAVVQLTSLWCMIFSLSFLLCLYACVCERERVRACVRERKKESVYICVWAYVSLFISGANLTWSLLACV
jgi:hypothetical protein